MLCVGPQALVLGLSRTSQVWDADALTDGDYQLVVSSAAGDDCISSDAHNESPISLQKR